jgi:hypothetical protein
MPFKWPFGEKAKGKKAKGDPLEHHLILLDELLEQFPVKTPDKEQNLREVWKDPDKRYEKRGKPEYLYYKCRDLIGAELLGDLKNELQVPYMCQHDPEARGWTRAFESMVTGKSDSYHYRWGAHEMVVEIHRFGPDRYTIVRKQFSDYYV